MSAKSPRVRLQHIRDEIESILATVHGLTSEEILSDYRNRRTTERAIQIISEAAKELPAELRAQEPAIPWKDIIGIGNLLRHEYHRISPQVLEDILHQHLPALRPAVMRLLDRFKPG